MLLPCPYKSIALTVSVRRDIICEKGGQHNEKTFCDLSCRGGISVYKHFYRLVGCNMDNLGVLFCLYDLSRLSGSSVILRKTFEKENRGIALHQKGYSPIMLYQYSFHVSKFIDYQS